MLLTMEEQEDRRGRSLCALQVAAVAGFAENLREMQQSCLGICNACRDGVPMPLLKITRGVPSSLLQMLGSGTPQVEGDTVSRVVPHRRVLGVEWTFLQFRAKFEAGKVGGSGTVMDISTVKWPQETRSINLQNFNQSVQEVVWPASLERLAFGKVAGKYERTRPPVNDMFNRMLDGVYFPSGIREIFLGEAFDQPIDNVAWPEGLEKLSLPGFNRPIDNVRWPAGLKILEFMPSWQVEQTVDNESRRDFGQHNKRPNSFNQRIHAGLPAGLHTLWLSDDFDQPIDTVVWPTELVTLGFGEGFRQSLSGVAWPSTLRQVFLVHRPFGYEDSGLPHGCDIILPMESDSDGHEYTDEGCFDEGNEEPDGELNWNYMYDEADYRAGRGPKHEWFYDVYL